MRTSFVTGRGTEREDLFVASDPTGTRHLWASVAHAGKRWRHSSSTLRQRHLLSLNVFNKGMSPFSLPLKVSGGFLLLFYFCLGEAGVETVNVASKNV